MNTYIAQGRRSIAPKTLAMQEIQPRYLDVVPYLCGVNLAGASLTGTSTLGLRRPRKDPMANVTLLIRCADLQKAYKT